MAGVGNVRGARESGSLAGRLSGQEVVAAGDKNPAVVVREYLQRMAPEIARALPKHLSADRLARVALTAIRSNPQLLSCSTDSLMAAVMLSAQLGLEPGPLGHCYYVPYRNKRTGGMDVQFIIGYKGYLDLLRRSGQVQSVSVHEVCDGDEFEYEYGLLETLRHKPALTGRGKPYAYYCIVRYVGGGYSCLVMSREDIEKHRQRSASRDSGPWVTDYDEMAKKTVVRALAKYLPLSVEVARAEAQDESVHERPEEDLVDLPGYVDTQPDDNGRVVYDVEHDHGSVDAAVDGAVPGVGAGVE